MKKFIYLVVISTLAFGAVAFAAGGKADTAKHTKQWARAYGLAGCGLGSMALGKDGNQILAGTTNGTFGSQTFGITTGTSNCVDGPDASVAKRMDNFVIVNKVALASDIARGNGEALKSLAAIAGCSNTQQFGTAMQKNFNTIYPNEKVQANVVTDSIMTVIKNDENLSKTCSHVG